MMRGFGAASLMILAWTSPAGAREAPTPGSMPPAAGAPRNWSENFQYRVEIDGAVSARARLFATQGRPALLLVAPELREPAVIQINGREVLKTEPAAVAEGPVPTQVVLADSEIHGPADPYTREGDAVIFFRDGHKIRVSPRPPLIGPATTEDLLSQLPAYRKGMDDYAPSDSDISYLKSYKYAVKVEVFFGSWCPHCRVSVPTLIKSVSQAANPNIQLSFHGVPTPPFGGYEPAREKKVDGVPTFIVYADDKEIGRFSTIPGDSRVEHELVKVLYAYQQSRG
ncbi:MAG TPA: thioredoxin family protein [Candidatus Polarisedimenticolia bacterium]|jgi:thiol-disulfide isomerase/thioredoxin